MVPAKLLTLGVILVSLVLGGCGAIKGSMASAPYVTNAWGWTTISDRKLTEMYVNAESQFAEVNGYTIHYRDVGRGEPVVLLHGLFSSLHGWQPWVDELKSNYRVITLDLPGFGMTGGPETEGQYSEEDALKTIEMFIDKLGLDQFSLVGNSLGGYYAARYAMNHPDRVDQLILSDPIGFPQKPSFVTFVGSTLTAQQIGKIMQPPLVLGIGIWLTYGDDSRLDETELKRYLHFNQRRGAKQLYLDTFAFVELINLRQEPLPFFKIAAPTLIMWGEADTMTPLEQASQWRDYIQDSKVVVYPTVGHYPVEEMPKRTVDHARKFLQNGLEEFPDYSTPDDANGLVATNEVRPPQPVIWNRSEQ